MTKQMRFMPSESIDLINIARSLKMKLSSGCVHLFSLVDPFIFSEMGVKHS